MPSPPEAWTRGARIALIALVAGSAAALVALHHPWYERSEQTAVTLAAARGLATEIGAFAEAARNPSGLALLFAPFAGGERLDFGGMHLVTTLSGVALLVLLFLFQRPRLGWPAAGLATLAVGASPGFLRACNQVSDAVPGTALLLACLCFERWSARRPSPSGNVVLGVLAGLAACVRPFNLVVVPALLVSRSSAGSGRSLRERAALLFGTALGTLPWILGALSQPLLAPQALRGGVAGILEWLGTGLRSGQVETWPELAWSLGLGLGLLIVLVRRREAAELAAVLELGLLCVVSMTVVAWSGRTGTDLLPALAVGLPALLGTLRDGFGRLLGRNAGTTIACVTALLWIGTRFDPANGRRELRLEHESLVEFAVQVEARVPEDAHVASGLGLHLALFLDREVAPLAPPLVPRPRSDPLDRHEPFDRESEDALEAWIDREDVDTLALYPRIASDLRLVPYVLRRYGERDPERVVTIPPGFLVRVR